MSGSESVEHPVQQQLEAYNARDVDAFMRWWAPDCRYHAFPSQLLAKGADAVRARHVPRFEEPTLHGRLLHRISVGDVVVDREVVTRTFPEGPGEVDVMAIYQVAAGRIAQAWFRMGTPRLHPPGTVSILPAASRDAAAVRALTRKAYAPWVPLLGGEPLPMTTDYEAAVRDHRVDRLFLDGRLVGVIEMVPETDHLLVRNVAVAPEVQGRGLGRTLLAHAEEVATSLGHAELRLYTNARFARNVRLYRSVGYAVNREEPFMGGATLHMSKRLRARSGG